MHVNGGGEATCGSHRRVEHTEVVVAAGRRWLPQMPGGLGSSPDPPPLPSRSSSGALICAGDEISKLGRQSCRL
jgi:hypothetical protein